MQKKSLFYIIIFIVIAIVLYIVIVQSQTTAIKKDINMAEKRNLATMLTTSTVVNYLTKRANPKNGIAIRNCTDAANLFDINDYYQILAQPIAARSVQKCTLVSPDKSAHQFYEIGVR